ncbi:MAG: hypothetical protein ACREO2_11655, partial [Arenimonas sp.]
LTLSETLDRVRDRRLRMTKWVFLTAILLWWPMIFVAFRGLFGVDLLPFFHPSFHMLNTVLGLVCIPVIYWVMRFVSRRYAKSPGFKNFLEETAGKSWSHARKQLDARQRFEDEVATHGDARALQRHEKNSLLSPAANASLRVLKKHVLVSIFFYGALILLIGLFNAQHGGQWQFIAPGILLNLFFVAHMVSGITHRIALTRLDLGIPSEEVCKDLVHQTDMRLAFARAVLAMTPIVGTALLQVFTEVLFGFDLIEQAPVYLLFGIIPVLVLTAAAIYRKSSNGAVQSYANISSLGVLKRSKILVETIKQASTE